MSSADQLHDDNFKVFVKFRPINKYERDSWKESNLMSKLEEFGLDNLRQNFNFHRKFRNPKNWYKYQENNSTNNHCLSDIGMQTNEIKMFRKMLRVNSPEDLAGENMTDVIPYKIDHEEHQLESINPKTKEVKSFRYDNILWSDVTQMHAFKLIGYRTVEGALNGINGTIFAYGQSGTGKTYSLLGPEPLSKSKTNNFGILPMSVHYIFHSIAKDDDIVHHEITASFLEIYLEQMKDLIEPGKPGKKEKRLKILEMAEGEFRMFMAEKEGPTALRKMKMEQRKQRKKKEQEIIIVQNLSEHRLHSAKDFVKLTVQANANRQKHATKLNVSSSRSHMICQVLLKLSRRNGTVTLAKLNIVDLAGSEKISKTKVKGKALNEAKSINASLTTLRTVIDGLAKGKKHIPFRDSKLSMLLKDSLGGNTRTSLLITVSPHKWNFEESMLSLGFGKKAKFVQNKVKVNVKLDEQELLLRLQKSEAEVQKLRKVLDVTANSLEGKEKQVKNLEQFISMRNSSKQQEHSISSDLLNQSIKFRSSDGGRHSIVKLLRRTSGATPRMNSRASAMTPRMDRRTSAATPRLHRPGVKRTPSASVVFGQGQRNRIFSPYNSISASESKNDPMATTALEQELATVKKNLMMNEQVASEAVEKCTKLEGENQELREKVAQVGDFEKTIQELELRLMEQANQLKSEKESKERFRRSSATNDSSKVLEDLEMKLLEKTTQLKSERETRQRLEKKVVQLSSELDRVSRESKEEELQWSPRQGTLSISKASLSKIVSQIFDEKEQEKVVVELSAVDETDVKTGPPKPPPKQLHFVKNEDNLELSSAEETKTRVSVIIKKKNKGDEEEEDVDRFSISKLTGLTERRVNALDFCNQGDNNEDVLKVWLMIMMFIQEREALGGKKRVSLAQFFNFHSGLSIEVKRTMQIARMFGILDNMNSGYITDHELTTFFKQVREIDALKWGFDTENVDLEIALSRLTEVLEVSFFTARADFKDLDVDQDGELTIYDLITYLKNNGGRKWWKEGSDFSDQAIVEVLTRVHLMKWKDEYESLNFEKLDPPPVNEEEWEYFLQMHYIGRSYVEIKDEFLETLPVEMDMLDIFEHIIPNWRSLFKKYSDSELAFGLSVEGAQVIVSMLRASIEDEAPKVEHSDKGVIYLAGLSQAQMEMMVRSCPVKIWQTLIDRHHEEPAGDRENEFLKLKETIAEALLLMQEPDDGINECNDFKQGVWRMGTNSIVEDDESSAWV